MANIIPIRPLPWCAANPGATLSEALGEATATLLREPLGLPHPPGSMNVMEAEQVRDLCQELLNFSVKVLRGEDFSGFPQFTQETTQDQVERIKGAGGDLLLGLMAGDIATRRQR